MSHRRAKRIRRVMILYGFHPKQDRPGYQYSKSQAKGTRFPTLKEMHDASLYAHISNPKPTGIL